MAPAAWSDHVLGGRYRLLEKLGAGGFGRVWKAHDDTLNVDVAVKEVWLPPAASDAERVERLRRAEREARNAARLRDHPNIVAVHDVVVDDDEPWIVMRLVEGRSLAEYLSTDGPLPADAVLAIARALLRALGAAHEVGISHRDVKPANVMLTTTGEVLLTDFGIAVHEADTTLTATNAFIGSVEYAAPERLRGTDSPTSDLFSLGVTLYQAVEGISPFRRDTVTASITAVLFEVPPPPRHAGERLAPLITGLLDKDPAQRPTIARALELVDTPVASVTEPMTLPGRHLPSTKREFRPVTESDPVVTRPPPRGRTRVPYIPFFLFVLGVTGILFVGFGDQGVVAAIDGGMFVAVVLAATVTSVATIFLRLSQFRKIPAVVRIGLSLAGVFWLEYAITGGVYLLRAGLPQDGATWASIVVVTGLGLLDGWRAHRFGRPVESGT